MVFVKRIPQFTLIAAIACVSWGCGSGDGLPRQAVSGKVTLDEKPLEKGLITFMPAGQGGDSTSAAAEVTNGSFSLAKGVGLVAGPYRVSISVMKDVPNKSSKKKQIDNATGEVIDAIDAVTKESLPARYNAQTELKADVTDGGPNEFDFPVTSK